jgi:hypothetical protein
MSPAGFGPAIPASERPQTHALDRAATGIDSRVILVELILLGQIGTIVSRHVHSFSPNCSDQLFTIHFHLIVLFKNSYTLLYSREFSWPAQREWWVTAHKQGTVDFPHRKPLPRSTANSTVSNYGYTSVHIHFVVINWSTGALHTCVKVRLKLYRNGLF